MSSQSPIIFTAEELILKYKCVDSIRQYLDFLLEENQIHNLVSRETSRTELFRIASESLAPLEIIGCDFTSYLDLGSGGGFPAVPIMLAFQVQGKNLQTYLVERRIKKATALKRITDKLGLPAVYIDENFEQAKLPDNLDLITIRLVKPIKKLIKTCHGILREQGRVVYFGGRDRFEFSLSGWSVSEFDFHAQGGTAKKLTILTKS